MNSDTKVSRRFFLSAAAAAGGGLLIGSTLEPELTGALAQTQAKDIPLNAWLRVSADDVVTLISSQSEMGQGVMTTLPAALAEELGADWSRVKIEFSPVAPAYRNPRINWQFTGNSESATAFFELLRTMGASAREMLIAAAANRWRVKPEECYADNGKVVHRPLGQLAGRSLKFGEVAEDAAKVTPPTNPKIKPESEWKLLGKPLSRVDLPAKLNGTAIFGMDFSLPGMVHAAVMQSPVHGGAVASFDKSSAMGMPGVIDVVPIPNGVAVVAGQYWQASRALKSLKVTFDAGPNAQVSTGSLNTQYRAALDGNVWKTVKTAGKAMNGEAMAGQFADVYSQECESQFLAHATMEPMNCTAHVTADSCSVWGPLQGNQLAQIVLASVLELPPEKVAVNRTLLGGGFGRRLLADLPLQAALISRAVGKPVKAVWSREEDMQHDVYRPATLQRVTAGLDQAGKPEAIAHKVVSPSILQFVYGPVGFWWSELSHPYFVLTERGCEIEVFSLAGGKCEADAMSDPRDTDGFATSDLITMGFIHTPSLMELVEKTRKVSQIDVNRFDAILVAGGQGPMFTFDKAFELHKKFVEFYEAGRDGNLITGQQSQSGMETAEALAAALGG